MKILSIFKGRGKAKKANTGVIDKQWLYNQLINSGPAILYDANNYDFIGKGYAGNPEVYSIIEKITSKLNLADPYNYIDNANVKRASNGNKKIDKFTVSKNRLTLKKLDFDDESDLAKLIKSPNELQTWRDFITLVRIYYFTQGEAFIQRTSGDDDVAIRLEVLHPHYMKPEIKDNKITGWIYFFNGKRREFLGDDMKDILHIKKPNPVVKDDYSHFRGLSPLVAGLNYLKLDDVSLVSWIKSVENEGGKGIISPSHSNPEFWLTPDAVLSTQAKIDEKVNGKDNRNKIAVAGMPLQYSPIGLSPAALNIISGLEHSGKKLCELWGVPPVLFESDPTYQNQKEGAIRFVKEVILPYLNIEEDVLNKWLVEPFIRRDKKKYVLDYDLFAYDELRLNTEDIDLLLKTHTINEVRVMLGSDEIENEYANEVFISNGSVPLSDFNIGI